MVFLLNGLKGGRLSVLHFHVRHTVAVSPGWIQTCTQLQAAVHATSLYIWPLSSVSKMLKRLSSRTVCSESSLKGVDTHKTFHLEVSSASSLYKLHWNGENLSSIMASTERGCFFDSVCTDNRGKMPSSVEDTWPGIIAEIGSKSEQV